MLSVRAVYACGAAALLLLFGSRGLQNAVAEGDTRTISLHHIHTDEDITITFKRDGRYDEAALEKLNWFLRDWRKQQETKMDPHLIDLVWETQREAGSTQPIWVVCGYRSPETNAMLRRRSSGVARFSQHMLGHAMDFYIPGVPLEKLRVIGLRLQRGGVGFYPSSGSPFVHLDTGGIRMWPRMTREQLVRVFPDQRTVYLPTDGKPLAGYELALADIRKRGGDAGDVNVADAGAATGHFNPFAKLLHLARADDDDEDAGAPQSQSAAAAPDPEPLHTRAKAAIAAAVEHAKDKLDQAKDKLDQAKDKVKDKLAAGKAGLAAAASRVEDKLGTEKTKIAQAASKAHVISRAEAAPLAETPNQIILARGFWQGVPDGMAAERPAQAATSAIAAVARTAPADSTGSVGRFAAAGDDAAPPGVVLAYVEPASQADGEIASASPTAILRAALLRAAASQAASGGATTVAVKRINGRPASGVLTVSTAKIVTLPGDAARLSDPWLRAIVVSPSVTGFLNITALGAHEFRSLAALMIKPQSSVMMPLAADPNPGLSFDRFSGSAVVFMPTVTYTLRTAQLQ